MSSAKKSCEPKCSLLPVMMTSSYARVARKSHSQKAAGPGLTVRFADNRTGPVCANYSSCGPEVKRNFWHSAHFPARGGRNSRSPPSPQLIVDISRTEHQGRYPAGRGAPRVRKQPGPGPPAAGLREGGTPPQILGRVTPICPWYFPPRSRQEVSQTSSDLMAICAGRTGNGGPRCPSTPRYSGTWRSCPWRTRRS